jgi:hypothetical protein
VNISEKIKNEGPFLLFPHGQVNIARRSVLLYLVPTDKYCHVIEWI